MYNTKYNTKYNNKYNSKYKNDITCVEHVYELLMAHVSQDSAARSSQSWVFIRVVWLIPKRSQQRHASSSNSELRVLDGETGCLPYLGQGVRDLRQVEEGTVLLLQWGHQVAIRALGQVQRQGLQVRCRASHMVLVSWRGRSVFVVFLYHY
jgi:hypothetical protein